MLTPYFVCLCHKQLLPTTGTTPAMTNLHKMVWHFQQYLQTLAELFNGGFWCEVVAGLNIHHLKWTLDAHTIMAMLDVEKTLHAKTNQVPLCAHLCFLIEFFIQHIQPWLLHQQHPGHTTTTTTTMTTTSLWVSYHTGKPLKYSSYTKSLQQVSCQFHPQLHLSSLSYHQAFVMAFFKGQISYSGTFDDALCCLGVFLNMSTPIMETHYNHHSTQDKNKATQAQLCHDLNFKGQPAVRQLLNTIVEHFAGAVNPAAHAMEVVGGSCPHHLTVNDQEWANICKEHSITSATTTTTMPTPPVQSAPWAATQLHCAKSALRSSSSSSSSSSGTTMTKLASSSSSSSAAGSSPTLQGNPKLLLYMHTIHTCTQTIFFAFLFHTHTHTHKAE
jgi:hypothetical protein